MTNEKYEKLNSLVRKLSIETDIDKSFDAAIDIAGEVMRIFMPNDVRGASWAAMLPHGEDALDKVIPTGSFPNQKVETWFGKHPYLGGQRLALRHFNEDAVPFESKFYWLNRSASKARVTAGVMLTPNWEDSDLTKHPGYKVGIDFFLSADANSLFVVVSETGKLRVLELSDHLSNTQIEIMGKIDGAGGFDGIGNLEPQRTIHKTLWDAFALKEVNKKFYDGIASHFQELLQHLISSDGGNRDENDAKQFANRLLGRLLFIWFLRKKQIINEDIGYFDSKSGDAASYYQILLKPLFFDTLNKPIADRPVVFARMDKKTPYLNGGLFDPHENDWIWDTVSFPPAWFDTLYEHFGQFNFTTDESSPEYEQVAIDPEMLGRVFENLLAAQRTETGKQARKANGAFYTPREIVSYMCRESFRNYLYAALENDAWHEGVDKLLDMPDSEFQVKHSDAKKELFGKGNMTTIVPAVLAAIDRLKVLDPACGSGAFPMGMLQLLLKTIERLDPTYDSYKAKLRILENSIFGVDIEPMAVELSRLRAWLSIVVDETDVKKVKPLPNLDFKFICANTLVPLPKEGERGAQLQMIVEEDTHAENELLRIRSEYFIETDRAAKERLQSEYIYAQQISTFFDRAKMIQKWDPFNATEPALFFDNDIMYGIKDGFDIVIGNPPYIHLEHIKEQSQTLYRTLGYSTYEARGDIYLLFYERGLGIVKDKGLLCYITSNKWMRAAYGQSLRGFLSTKTNPIKLIDFAGQQIFDATVDTNIMLLSKDENKNDTEATIIKNSDGLNNLSVYIKQNSIKSKFGGDGSWTILSDIERRIKEKIEAVGVPLRDWDISINYGIKTGCNEAFIISGEKRDELIKKDPKSAEIIRPILRGRDIKRYGYEFADQYLIATHNGYADAQDNRIPPVDIDKYPSVKEHLDKYWDRIAPRTDCGTTPYNLRNCAYMDDFSQQQKSIIWADLARTGNAFAFSCGGVYIANTSYILTQRNPDESKLLYILGFLNSKSILFYMDLISSKLDETGWRWFKQFVERLPIPPSAFNNEVASAVSNRLAMCGQSNSATELDIDRKINEIYDFSTEEIMFLTKFERQE
jgi:hypothetical protein